MKECRRAVIFRRLLESEFGWYEFIMLVECGCVSGVGVANPDESYKPGVFKRGGKIGGFRHPESRSAHIKTTFVWLFCESCPSFQAVSQITCLL